jgi:hypothetical protein
MGLQGVYPPPAPTPEMHFALETPVKKKDAHARGKNVYAEINKGERRVEKHFNRSDQ